MSALTDSQRASKNVAHGAGMPLVTPRGDGSPTMLVPIEMVRQCKTEGAAFTLACNASGLDDKEIYMPLAIDPGTFSKIKAGKATFPRGQLRAFCLLVNNFIFPQFLAYQVGCTLTLIETEAERMLRLEREKREALEAENQILRKMLVKEAP